MFLGLFQLKSQLPLLQFQRFRGKINIQRPKQPHYDRALVIAVTTPQLPKPPKNQDCFKEHTQKVLVENPYNNIIARETLNWLNHSRMIAIFHLNSIKADDLFEIQVKLHRKNMQLKRYGRNIMIKALEGTRYEALLPLFDSEYCLVLSPEQNVDQLLKIVRKVQQMVLLAGVVDNTLLNRNDFMAYAQLPSLPIVQSQLVNTINMAAQHLVQHLNSHQNHLVQALDVYCGDTSNENESTNSNSTKE